VTKETYREKSFGEFARTRSSLQLECAVEIARAACVASELTSSREESLSRGNAFFAGGISMGASFRCVAGETSAHW
jgi:hypothetical protein